MTAATHVLEQSIVVFSQNYLPISRVNIRRAIVLLLTGKAEPLAMMNVPVWKVRSPSQVIEVPEHIRLTIKGKERSWRVPPVNRREVLRRDHHTCQYCGSTHNLTLDHVVPLSRGGSHTWDNVVTACERCNQRKGNRTPEEANMPLRSKPRAPLHPTVAFAEQFWHKQQSRQEQIYGYSTS
ncbi:HNH endonuclease [Synechococcus sp. H65.1]|uniref:HNH endonuclease n=1 Tax=unclassified Synechococcus TaxID=2626047 RepID=UPI0039C04F35